MRCLWVVLLLSGCFEVPNETRLMPEYEAEVMTAARAWDREYGGSDGCAVHTLTYSVNDLYFNAGPDAFEMRVSQPAAAHVIAGHLVQ